MLTCSCPKCQSQIELDQSRIPVNGNFSTCPDCKNRFWINRESHARMALKKDGKTYCDQCGKELHQIFTCESCGVIFPDYYLVQTARPPRRQVEKQALFSTRITLKQAKPSYTYTYTGSSKSGPSISKPSIGKVTTFALVALLAIGAAYFYHIKKFEENYITNYMRALYTIKSGTEFGLNECAKVSFDWKSNIGNKYVPHISIEAESKLNRFKDATDSFMKQLSEPPNKFTQNQQKLEKLYSVYIKINTLAIAPTGSFSSFIDTTKKSEGEYISSINELKNNMPFELSEGLEKAKTKYKGLRGI
jgi:hypothetical protein